MLQRMRRLDFIGDIHGQAEMLRKALQLLDYKEKAKAFRHPYRTAVFLGDLLNRGPEIRAAVQIVRSMVEARSAICLLGNHEAFALWDRLHSQRPESFPDLPEKALRHLADSKADYRGRGAEWSDLLNWFWRQPLFFDHYGVRAVHACWHPESLQILRGNQLSDACFQPNQPEFHALWRIIEGPSVRHPQSKKKFRIRWWERQATTWQEFAFSGRRDLPDCPIPKYRLRLATIYPCAAPPCFFGHYGFVKLLGPLRPNLACLDLAVAQGGPIGVYRWQGEKSLNKSNFIAIGA